MKGIAARTTGAFQTAARIKQWCKIDVNVFIVEDIKFLSLI